jgi:plasmid stability protein
MKSGNQASRQYTIRNVPPSLDRALRREAARTRRSLNAIALDALAKAVQLDGAEHHDLDAFFGSWVEDPAVDRALHDQRRVDADLWK